MAARRSRSLLCHDGSDWDGDLRDPRNRFRLRPRAQHEPTARRWRPAAWLLNNEDIENDFGRMNEEPGCRPSPPRELIYRARAATISLTA